MSSPTTSVGGPSTVVASVDCTVLPFAGQQALLSVDAEGRSFLLVDNLLDTPIDISEDTYLGLGEKTHERHIAEVLVDLSKPPASVSPSAASACDPDKLKFLKDTMRDQVANLPVEWQDKYVNLILDNHDVFSRDKFDLGRTSAISHSVTLRYPEPVFRKQFRIPEAHRSVLLEHLNNWIKLGVVSPCKSAYNSPIFLVPKKDGSLRPVLDFRGVNDKTRVDKYAQREVSDCIDELGRSRSKIFSSLDLTAGFWQLPLDEQSRSFTAFTLPGCGQYSWNMTPMGLLGSPASFGRLMDYVMSNLRAITYQDDVLIHSEDHLRHLTDLQLAFDRLRAHGLKLNLRKCAFGQSEVAYLGFLLTPEGILPGRDKAKALADFPVPTSVRQVKEFVGLANFFRHSVPNFSTLSQPLTFLTSNSSSWREGLPFPEKALSAFRALQQALISPPVLAYPDPSKQYHLMVDAALGSEHVPGGLGACLVQFDENDVPRAVGFASRRLKTYEKNYTAYLLELQAACFGISHFDTYLRGKKFFILITSLSRA